MIETNDSNDSSTTPLSGFAGEGPGVRFIIAGGGTGGHIFPAIAIANALMKIDGTIEILFVGAKGKMEMEKVPQAGYNIEGLDIAGFNRSSLIKNIGLPVKLVKSFLQVRRIFKNFRPHAAIGVGGYSSFPVLRFAQARNIFSFIHESNSFAGRSNMMLGRKATKIFVATDGMQKFFPAKKIMVTGNPVRPDIVAVATIEKEEALNFFGMQVNKKTVLVVGGSLGARSINEAIASGIDELINAGLQIIWQTGKTDAAKWSEVAANRKEVWVSDFIKEMQYAYAAADIV
ncbi:MAG: UDP-N-acetylglucosamine--N-acetylmuramyl-(pentapeptide) pyrophosphoryl-undecaprenol N-acetylglucosamine transferase, partial [Bacteroidota bacterium]|nr:UDP-N-acetylglucosamine--N-acetylmuramyl-(pentapeptide) pyrophosphoryl-undecaprenol N-acetylglucosamine transferase [Bacteroidota bacterium]